MPASSKYLDIIKRRVGFAHHKPKTFTEAERDRVQLYQLMADLAQAEAETKREMYRMISNLDRRQDEPSRRQAEIVEILKLLTQK